MRARRRPPHDKGTDPLSGILQLIDNQLNMKFFSGRGFDEIRTSSPWFLSNLLREVLGELRALYVYSAFNPSNQFLAVTHNNPAHPDIVAEALEACFMQSQ